MTLHGVADAFLCIKDYKSWRGCQYKFFDCGDKSRQVGSTGHVVVLFNPERLAAQGMWLF